jgi:hypothetical protein
MTKMFLNFATLNRSLSDKQVFEDVADDADAVVDHSASGNTAEIY